VQGGLLEGGVGVARQVDRLGLVDLQGFGQTLGDLLVLAV